MLQLLQVLHQGPLSALVELDRGEIEQGLGDLVDQLFDGTHPIPGPSQDQFQRTAGRSILALMDEKKKNDVNKLPFLLLISR